MGVIVLVSGLVIDLSRISAVKMQLQRATDAGALAAAKTNSERAQDAAESLFDATIDSVRSQTKTLERTYAFNDPEHVVSAKATVATFVLRATEATVVEAQSAAQPGREGSTAEVQTATCIHVGDASSNPALTLAAGAAVNGPNCMLVLQDDNPNRVIVHPGASLNIAGFCVNGPASASNISALTGRLSLPYKPEACAAIEMIEDTMNEPCQNLPDEELPMTPVGQSGDAFSYPGGRYCGFVRLYGANRDLTQSGSPVLEAREGDMFLNARSLNLTANTLLVSQSLPDIHISVALPSLLRAQADGPYAGVAILQRTTAFDASNVVLNGPLSVQGAILSPNLTLTLDGGSAQEPREMGPIRATHLSVGADASIYFAPFEEYQVEIIAPTSPRLVR